MDDYTVAIPKNTRETIRPRGTPVPPNQLHRDKKKYTRKGRMELEDLQGFAIPHNPVRGVTETGSARPAFKGRKQW